MRKELHLTMNIAVSTDKSLLDINLITSFLQGTYWGKDHTDEQIKRSIEHSFCFGLYLDGKQIGFARVVSDFTYFAWLADVFILPELQKTGYGQHFINSILNHPELQGVKWRLRTKDAHEFYIKLGFVRTTNIERLMER